MASAESKLEDLVGLLEELRKRVDPAVSDDDADLAERIDGQLDDLNRQLRTWAGSF